MHTRTLILTLSLAAVACGPNPGNPEDGGSGAGTGGSAGGGAGGGTGGCGPTVDFTKDPLNCGVCGNVCTFPNATASCKAGVCAVKGCLEGFRNLDGDPANGCELACSPMALTTSGNLDFNLNVIQLSGRVTMGGQTLPPAAPRGVLRFDLSGSKSISIALPASGEATYATKLFAGQYRVYFEKDGREQLLKSGAFSTTGAIDFDVSASSADGGTVIVNPTPINLNGTVTGNSLALSPGPRGSVRFIPKDGATVSATLPVAGAATYAVTLMPGLYDIVLDGPTPCTASAVLPCRRIVKHKAMMLRTSGNLDLDVPILKLSGAVTVNGQAMAGGAGERGGLRLVDPIAHEDGPRLSLGTTGPAQWSTLLYPGTYEVQLERTNCSVVGPLPCQTRAVKKAVVLNASGVLDVDVKVLELSGQVTVNGQLATPSMNGSNRGKLSFLAKDEGGPSVDLGTTGAAAYQLKLYAGVYDLVLENTLDCPASAFPCGEKTLKPLTLNASGVLDVDVAVVRVSGDVTVNGAAMTSAPGARGTLTLEGTQAISTVKLGSSGPALWAATLHPGVYMVELENSETCATGPLPCQTRVLETARSFTADGSLSWDVPVIALGGAVTLNNLAVTAASGNIRGELVFKEKTLGKVTTSLGKTGAATYATRLYPATYQVLFHNQTDCPASDTQPLPCQGDAELEAATALTASGARDFNLSAVTLSGLVQLNGGPMPSSGAGQSRAELRFATFGSTPASRDLGPVGTATYQIRLVPGRYDIGIENTDNCGPTGVLPCQKQVLVGCEAP